MNITELSYKFALTRAVGCVVYARKKTGFSYRVLTGLWGQAMKSRRKGSSRNEDAAEFFYLLAGAKRRASDTYRCLYNQCVIIWFNGRNTGGAGVPGCPCDNMADGRGELLKRGTSPRL